MHLIERRPLGLFSAGSVNPS